MSVSHVCFFKQIYLHTFPKEIFRVFFSHPTGVKSVALRQEKLNLWPLTESRCLSVSRGAKVKPSSSGFKVFSQESRALLAAAWKRETPTTYVQLRQQRPSVAKPLHQLVPQLQHNDDENSFFFFLHFKKKKKEK